MNHPSPAAITLCTRDVPPRSQWALEQAGIPPLLAKLYAARGVQSRQSLDDSLGKLLPPDDLLGNKTAALRLVQAITQQERICIVADYDCDGATACAVAVRGLRMLGARHVDYLVPNRVTDGYGLTPPISEQVALRGAQLLITVDNGIASIEGVAHAKKLGLAVIVTDHHLPIAQIPVADAIVNPNQVGCPFASKSLAGVGVMFYVLLAVRALQRDLGIYTVATQPRLDTLLPLVALGTVADLVKLDENNRRLVAQGLRRVRAKQLPAGMAALFEVAARPIHQATTSDFGFMLAPRINAAGRLSDMQVGIECLITDDATHARALARQLDAINRERREIESTMREQALELARQIKLAPGLDNPTPENPASPVSVSPTPCTVCVFDESFHEGIVGIVASRLKDQWHLPTFVFARSGAQGKSHELKGSGRSIAGFHLRDALDVMAKRHPDLLLRFGGHAMAAGCTIHEAHLQQFQTAFAQVAHEGLDAALLQRRLLTDGSLPLSDCRVDVAETLNQEVWGQGFLPPLFCDTVDIISQRLVGEKHLALKVKHQGGILDAIWFYRTEPVPDKATVAYRLDAQEWQGNKRVQWIVETVLENTS